MLSPSSSVPAYFSPTQSWINLQFDNFLLKGNFFFFFFPSTHFIKYTASSWLLNTFWCTGLGTRVSRGCLWHWEVQNVAKQRERKDFADGPVTRLCAPNAGYPASLLSHELDLTWLNSSSCMLQLIRHSTRTQDSNGPKDGHCHLPSTL